MTTIECKGRRGGSADPEHGNLRKVEAAEGRRNPNRRRDADGTGRHTVGPRRECGVNSERSGELRRGGFADPEH